MWFGKSKINNTTRRRKNRNMIKGNPSLCFDDILLVPQVSNIRSRKEIDLMMYGYGFPVVASPMDTVCDYKMAYTIANYGGIGFIHRYMNKQDQLLQLQQAFIKTTENGRLGIGIAISSIDVFDTEYIQSAIDLGCEWFCIDTANGHNELAVKAVKMLKQYGNNIKVMAGNVATAEGYKYLAMAGADAVRVGIGGGSACTTRIVTGHGVPTLQSVMDCYDAKVEFNLTTMIVADGGLKTQGDIVKAFAAGADLIMLGSMLAGTDESPGDVVDGHKIFRGMASAEAQLDWRGEVSVAEGISTKIPYKGSVISIFSDIENGLRSGCSYTGVENLAELSESAIFTVVTSNSINESRPHAVSR
jgi:IMP dehydrogenase